MRELEEVPFPSKYLLIFSQFTMTLCNYIYTNQLVSSKMALCT